ncbi:Hsp70 family protein [Streptomyces sp. NBC_00239]|uniref:Hsp70 family protein n=1 Tax=Streptomyces sp. NBC_00239 TaxID=2903640 RepID=UPI002E2A68B7|nr:Hsp70 family protein [Streptomyces sp. NBC_00239]
MSVLAVDIGHRFGRIARPVPGGAPTTVTVRLDTPDDLAGALAQLLALAHAEASDGNDRDPGGSGPGAAAVALGLPPSGAQDLARRGAATEAGLLVAHQAPEPVAAALAYGAVTAGADHTVLVLDQGATTLDLTLLAVTPDRTVRILDTRTHLLGGADWDRAVAAGLRRGLPGSAAPQESVLTAVAEDLRRQLSERETATATVTIEGREHGLALDRATLGLLTAPLRERAEAAVTAALAAAGHDPDGILLAGGLSAAPGTAERLEELLGLPVRCRNRPELAVVEGLIALAGFGPLRILRGPAPAPSTTLPPYGPTDPEPPTPWPRPAPGRLPDTDRTPGPDAAPTPGAVPGAVPGPRRAPGPDPASDPEPLSGSEPFSDPEPTHAPGPAPSPRSPYAAGGDVPAAGPEAGRTEEEQVPAAEPGPRIPPTAPPPEPVPPRPPHPPQAPPVPPGSSGWAAGGTVPDQGPTAAVAVSELSAIRRGDHLLVLWAWPPSSRTARVRWRAEHPGGTPVPAPDSPTEAITETITGPATGTGRATDPASAAPTTGDILVRRRVYEHDGGLDLHVGRGAVTLTVEALVSDPGVDIEEATALPVPAEPPLVLYEPRVRRRLGGGRTATVTFRCASGCTLPALRIVHGTGSFRPASPAEGTVLHEVPAQPLAAGVPLSVRFPLPPSRETSWLVCFPADPDSLGEVELRPVALHRLRVS